MPSAHSYQYVRQPRLLNRCKNNMEPFWDAVCIPTASAVFLITSLYVSILSSVSLPCKCWTQCSVTFARQEAYPRRRTSISAVEFCDKCMNQTKIKLKAALPLSTPRGHTGTVQVQLHPFWTRHQMEVMSGQFRAPFASVPGTEPGTRRPGRWVGPEPVRASFCIC